MHKKVHGTSCIKDQPCTEQYNTDVGLKRITIHCKNVDVDEKT